MRKTGTGLPDVLGRRRAMESGLASGADSVVADSGARLQLPRPTRSRSIWCWLGPLLAGVTLVYCIWSSAGNFQQWPVYSTVFDLLGEGFRRGHLYLPIDPAPELLAAANPYDRVNGRY